MSKRATCFICVAVALLLQSISLHSEKVHTSVTTELSAEQILNQKLGNQEVESRHIFGKTDRGPVDIYDQFPKKSLQRDGAETSGVSEKNLDVNFTDKDLVEVINQFAKLKGVNVILPTGANEIKSKVTLKIARRLSVSEAAKLLYTIIDIAGYSLIKRPNGFIVKKNDKNIGRIPAPIYIGVAPEQLPNSDKRIRYLCYLANIQVPNIGNEGRSELNTIIKQLLPKDAIAKYLPESNGVLIAGKANDIKAVMNIVVELDDVDFSENLEIIKLNNSSSRVVADLFTKSILSTSQDRTSRFKVGWRGKSDINYFSKNIKIISEDRGNSLILLGRQQAIDRVKEFIFKYIDVRLDSGNSILHTYQLQYLDAQPFAETLRRIVASSSTRSTGQSRASGTATGPERFFEGVIIQTDTPPPTQKGQERAYAGSNQLIVAARNDDWLRIKKLIEELDRPQPQVIIEVLIADLELTDERVLGSHTRTPASFNLPKIINSNSQGVEFQAASASPSVADTQLHVDLLNKDGFNSSGSPSVNVDPIKTMATGAMGIVSLSDNDGKTWSILQILQTYKNSKILSHPHVVATNNKEAVVEIGETRLLRAEATVGQGGSAIAKRQEKTASMIVKITPRISGGRTVNMQVSVDFKEFVGDTARRIDRKVITNANIESGSILALGGLIKIDTNQGLNEVPVLGKIPILGWLFRKRGGTTQKNNLTVFIRPTIIEPRLRGGIDRYTRDYINVAKEYVRDGMLFDTLRDPVTRWFFKTGVNAEEAIDVFAQESPQGRVAGLSSLDIADNEGSAPMPAFPTPAFSTPSFEKNPYRTVMAAAEGRGAYKRPNALSMKDDLMDYVAPEVPRVASKRFRKKQAKKARKAAKKDKVASASILPQENTKVANKEKVEETAIKLPISRDKQLKQMLSSNDNPLLS